MAHPQKHPRKLSEVFLEFVLHIVSEDDPPEIFERGLQLGMALWNLALLPERVQLREFDRICTVLHCEEHPGVKAQLARLFVMRKLLYGHDRRMICSYELVQERDSIRLFVVSVNVGPEQERKGNT